MKLLIEPDRFIVLFTDVRMPGDMDGVEVALQARTLDQSIPVIVASGHARDFVSRLEGLDPPIAFFPKPYRTVDIIATIRTFTA